MQNRRDRCHIDSPVHPSWGHRLRAPYVGGLGGGSEIDIATVADDLRILLSEDVHKFPRWLKDNIRFLQHELESMLVVLYKISEVPADELDEATKAWAEDLKDVSCDIKHAFDNFQAHVSSARQLGARGCASTCHFRLTRASKEARREFIIATRDIKQSIVEMVDRHSRYNLGGLVPSRRFSDDSPSNSVVDPKHLVAIDRHRDLLVNLLTDMGSTSNQDLKLASIVGLPGVGKTTLAKVVYDSLAPRFHCAAWVHLSNKPDINKVLKDLLSQISQQEQHDDYNNLLDVRDIIPMITEALGDKRYLVVVDDIWDLHEWNYLRSAVIENSNGSAILATSHKVDVAEHVGSAYTLPPLSEPDSRKLFNERLFGSEDNCPSELADISRKFIEKCGGVPLAIVTTTDLLVTKSRTPDTWHEVYDSIGYGDELRTILAPSYADLLPPVKSCLLYLSMFQKNYEIGGDRLVWGWIAEGFIQETQGKTLQEVAEDYLNDLINSNFIEPVEVDVGGKALSCRVLNTVHDFITSLSIAKSFATILDDPYSFMPGTVQRLSIQRNIVEQPPPHMLSQMRSLVVSGDANQILSLSDFRRLRVLDLGGFDSLQNDHLKGIEYSSLLKYLVIGGKCITCIPKEIGNLSWLQTLDLRATSLKELPEIVVRLKQLKCLCVNSHMMIPVGIGKMEALEDLSEVNISKPELLKDLSNLTKLRVLSIVIWSWDESYDEALLEYVRSLGQREQQNIRRLSILTCCSLHLMEKLDSKFAPQCVEKLEIRHSTFLTLPGWISSLRNLSSLSIEVYKLSQDIINMIGKMNKLLSLSLTTKHVAEGTFSPNAFSNLAGFRIASSALRLMFEPEAMQKLKRLKLSFEASWTEDVDYKFNFGLENLSSLEHVHVDIICFNASPWVVEKAEDAIRGAILRDCSRCPNPDIRRVQGEVMIESEDWSTLL